MDTKGNVYIADYRNNRIRKVSPGGKISTFAGVGREKPGTPGDGDGGPATSAQVIFPHGVAVDGKGNVYIAEEFSLVRKVSRTGTITTIAGRHPDDPCGGSYHPPCGADGGPATSAQLLDPAGIAVDGRGNVYFADSEDNRVRKVSPTGIISTIAGNGKHGFSGDGGRAISAKLRYPHGVAVDKRGNVYFADSANHRVRKVTPGGTITTFAGTGKNQPQGVAVDAAGNVYISEGAHVRKVSPAGKISTIAGSDTARQPGDGGPATRAALLAPKGVEVDGKGNVYIADSGSNRVRKVRP